MTKQRSCHYSYAEVDMKRVFAVVVISVVLTGFPLTIFAQRTPAWTTLFNGRSLDAFTPLGDANWKVVDGVVQSYPVIQSATFDQNDVVISGNFKEGEARDLARVCGRIRQGLTEVEALQERVKLHYPHPHRAAPDARRATALVVEAGRVLCLDREAMGRRADAAGLALVSAHAPDD